MNSYNNTNKLIISSHKCSAPLVSIHGLGTLKGDRQRAEERDQRRETGNT